jgi:hypothetical protein
MQQHKKGIQHGDAEAFYSETQAMEEKRMWE